MMLRGLAMAMLSVLAAGSLPAQTPAGAGTNRLPRLLSCDGPYTHPGLKMVFPQSVGVFRRSTITQYDARERDVGVGYTSTNARTPAIVSVCVFPAPSYTPPSAFAGNAADVGEAAFQAHLEDAGRAILRRYPGSRLATNELFTLTRGSEKAVGRRVTFELTFRFGAVPGDAISYLYLFHRLNWLIEYRVTFPKGSRMAADIDVDDFLQQLAWPK